MRLSRALKTRYSNSWGDYVTRDDVKSYLAGSKIFQDWVKTNVRTPDRVDEFINYAHNELKDLYSEFVSDRKAYLKETDLNVPYNEFTEAAKEAAHSLFGSHHEAQAAPAGNGSGMNGAPSVDTSDLAAPSPGHVKNEDIPDPRKKKKKKAQGLPYSLYLLNEAKGTKKLVKTFTTEDEAWNYYNKHYKNRGLKGFVNRTAQQDLQRDISETLDQPRRVDLKGMFFTIVDSLGALSEFLDMAVTQPDQFPQLVQMFSVGGSSPATIQSTVQELEQWLKNAYQVYENLLKTQTASLRYKKAQLDWQHHVDSTTSELEVIKQKFDQLLKTFVQEVHMVLQDQDSQRVAYNVAKQMQAISHTITQMQDRMKYMIQLEEAQ